MYYLLVTALLIATMLILLITLKIKKHFTTQPSNSNQYEFIPPEPLAQHSAYNNQADWSPLAGNDQTEASTKQTAIPETTT